MQFNASATQCNRKCKCERQCKAVRASMQNADAKQCRINAKPMRKSMQTNAESSANQCGSQCKINAK
eukprot:2476411-Pyramimonas_sp.AAC.1